MEDTPETGLANPNVATDISLQRLRTVDTHRFKQVYVNQGVSFLDVPVWQTPHFELLREYERNPGLSLESTRYWKLVRLALDLHRENGGGVYIHNERQEVRCPTERSAQLIELYENIKSAGMSRSIETKATSDGNYRIVDGLHRTAAVCALGQHRIATRIVSMDEQLVGLLRSLRDAYPDKGRRALYTPIDHPLFADWRVVRDATRWDLIKDEFPWRGHNILDVGSYTGFFSHKVASSGGHVTGIDLDNKRVRQSRQIGELLRANVQFLNADALEYLKTRQFDCVLFFSVLHWLLKEGGISRVAEALETLATSSPVLFLDMGQDNETKMRSGEWNHGLTINRETIPQLVRGNSRFRYYKHLGVGDTQRDVFKFSLHPIK